MREPDRITAQESVVTCRALFLKENPKRSELKMEKFIFYMMVQKIQDMHLKIIK